MKLGERLVVLSKFAFVLKLNQMNVLSARKTVFYNEPQLLNSKPSSRLSAKFDFEF